jgi:hypothetical protein
VVIKIYSSIPKFESAKRTLVKQELAILVARASSTQTSSKKELE